MKVWFMRSFSIFLTAFFRMLLGVSFASTLLAATPAFARTERLDDLTSPRSQVQAPQVTDERGRPLADSAEARFAIIKFGRVDYRLATGRFVGQQARIYYVVPASIPGLLTPSGLQVQWRGNGVFADGVARPGERHLVWAGTVRERWMSEGLDLTLQLDLRAVRLPSDGRFGFESYFEIETSP